MTDDQFKEIPLAPEVLDARAAPSAASDEPDQALERQRDELVRALRLVVARDLTQRQRRIIELYFFEGRTQQEVAEELGVSQQVVSRQLFGVMREGRKVGGAIRRLRKAFEELGLEWV